MKYLISLAFVLASFTANADPSTIILNEFDDPFIWKGQDSSEVYQGCVTRAAGLPTELGVVTRIQLCNIELRFAREAALAEGDK